MDMASLIQTYGYPVVFVGTFLEGETVLFAAAFAAHRGYLHPAAVVAIATCASFLGDQTFFWIGRRTGPALLSRLPALAPRVRRVDRILQRYQIPLVLSVRFLYGLRIAGPIAIGMSSIGSMKFFLLNLVGAIAWSVVIVGVGYAFGQGLEYLSGDIRRYEGWILLGILMTGFVWWGWRNWWERKKRRLR